MPNYYRIPALSELLIKRPQAKRITTNNTKNKPAKCQKLPKNTVKILIFCINKIATKVTASKATRLDNLSNPGTVFIFIFRETIITVAIIEMMGKKYTKALTFNMLSGEKNIEYTHKTTENVPGTQTKNTKTE